MTINAQGSFYFNGKTAGFYWSIPFHCREENKTGYHLRATYPVARFLDLEMRVQRNIYTTQLDAQSNFNEMIAWAGLRVRW